MGKSGRDSVRVTTTLTRERYEQLQALAAKHGVGFSWLLRRAADRLIDEAQGGPLLPLELARSEKRRG